MEESVIDHLRVVIGLVIIFAIIYLTDKKL